MYSVGFPPAISPTHAQTSAMQLFAHARAPSSGTTSNAATERSLINQRLQVLMNMSCLRMRGLPFSATIDDIQTFIGVHGKHVVGSVHIIYNLQGRPSGEAVVQLQHPEQAHKCSNDLHLKHMGERYIEVFQCCVQDMAWMLATSHANQLAAQQMSSVNNSKNLQPVISQKSSPPPLPPPKRPAKVSPKPVAVQHPSPTETCVPSTCNAHACAPNVRITQAQVEINQMKSSPSPPGMPLAVTPMTAAAAASFMPAAPMPAMPIYTAQYPLVTSLQIPQLPPIMSSSMFNPESPPFYPVNHFNFMNMKAGPQIAYFAYDPTAMQGPPPPFMTEQAKCGPNLTANDNRYVEMFLA